MEPTKNDNLWLICCGTMDKTLIRYHNAELCRIVDMRIGMNSNGCCRNDQISGQCRQHRCFHGSAVEITLAENH